MAINRPVILKRGWPGHIEANSVNAYLGEWVVFKLPMTETSNAEFRMPIEEALEMGLVIASDKLVFGPADFEDDEDE